MQLEVRGKGGGRNTYIFETKLYGKFCVSPRFDICHGNKSKVKLFLGFWKKSISIFPTRKLSPLIMEEDELFSTFLDKAFAKSSMK